MTDELKPAPGIIEDKMPWIPSEELIIQTIEELKKTPENMWDELKATELKVGNLKNDVGNKFMFKVREMHPDLNGFMRATLKMELRRRARKEAGIVDSRPSSN